MLKKLSVRGSLCGTFSTNWPSLYSASSVPVSVKPRVLSEALLSSSSYVLAEIPPRATGLALTTRTGLALIERSCEPIPVL